MKTCTIDGCDKPYRARGLCATHYNQQHQPERHRKATFKCGCCGVDVVTWLDSRRPERFCSYACRDAWSAEHRVGAFARVAKPKAIKPVIDQRSPLRIAVESGDREGIIAAIKADCDIRPSGCWEWRRKLHHSGYPAVSVARKSYQVHRLALEARLGKPLGKQPAHHMCANSFCVNPDHLQPVTARENIAEMHARTYLESRIADLEAALSLVAPTHPLLLEVGVVKVA